MITNSARPKFHIFIILGLLALVAFLVRDRPHSVASPPIGGKSNTPQSISPEEMIAFDKKSQHDFEVAREPYRNDPEFIPYIPDPKLTEKSIELQPFYDAMEVAYAASFCHLRHWEDSATGGLFSNLYFEKRNKTFQNKSDPDFAQSHNARVYESRHPEPFHATPENCGKLARSQELSNLDDMAQNKQ